jgi:uncharacterized protein YbaR (Trm112 family)
LNKKLLDILVCPFDKVTSLDLMEFQSLSDSNNKFKVKDSNISSDEKADQSSNTIEKSSVTPENDSLPNHLTSKNSSIVQEGLLLCKSCNRFYPITEEIPIILPDELRDKKKDIEFLKKWKDSIPNELLISLKPWTL